jgi:demethylmenaquinone methyltransferase/2-methoxy-6-polyprenyl-1,4-benzoquinol methylase
VDDVDDVDAILDEQRAYYRGRASTYDEWWLRTGAYASSDDERRAWADEIAVVEAALDTFGATGDVLELAGGTGWWTRHLARTATQLTIVDASSETLALNRERVQRDDVDYVLADIFDWQPARAYDVVFFSFWLSHVPRTRFSAFWQLVRSCLAPESGGVFFVDNRPQRPPGAEGGDPHVAEYLPDLHLRRLPDGSELRVVKVMDTIDELQERITAEGWRASIHSTRSFLFGSAHPV